MATLKFKSLDFIYQDTQIHYLIENEKEIMINATDMAKAFDKKIADFTRLENTKIFIQNLVDFLNSNKNNVADVQHYNEDDVLQTNKKAGTYMHRKLALKFAAWLEPIFEIWIIDEIENVLFGFYKKHWEAHAIQEQSKLEMEAIKKKLLIEPTPELVVSYFEEEKNMNNAKRLKSEAIRNQLNLFKQ